MTRGFLVVFLGLMVALIARGAAPVFPADFRDARQPQVCLNAAGDAFIVAGRSNSIYCVASRDGGKTFSPPTKVATVQKLSLGMRRGPRVSATKSAQIVSAISQETGNLLVWRSEDRGANWQAVPNINDEAHSAREGLHAMASDGGQRVFIAWLDLRSGKTEIWGALSRDEGKTWNKNVRIYQSPEGSVCECCHPSVVFTREGQIAVMWRNWLAGSRDLYWAESDDGERFQKGKKLGTGSWPLNGCPMDGGALVITPQGKLRSIWRRDKTILTAADSTGERALGEGVQPVAFNARHNLFYVWQRGASIVWRNDLSASLSILAENGRYAAAASGGPDQSAIVVWEATQDGRERIMAETVP
jgi:hypothetical protein